MHSDFTVGNINLSENTADSPVVNEGTEGLVEVVMENPTEKDGLQLETINNYGAKSDDGRNEVEFEDGSANRPDAMEKTTIDETIEDMDEFLDPDSLGMKEKLLLRVFPFLLRWPWFKKKLLKKKKEDDKCEWTV